MIVLSLGRSVPIVGAGLILRHPNLGLFFFNQDREYYCFPGKLSKYGPPKANGLRFRLQNFACLFDECIHDWVFFF